MPYLTARLTDFGPVINVLIGVTAPRRKLLEKHGLPVPSRVPVQALIDTGASISVVAPNIPQQLGLHATGKTSLLTASTGHKPHPCDEYDVSVTLQHPDTEIELLFAYVAVAATIFHPNEPYQVIIGRDLLAECLLVYDGQNGTFAFAF
jgi:predicted aspartyl protease